MNVKRELWILLLAMLLGTLVTGTIMARDATVHLIIFHSPQCPHCHTVLTEVLPPLQEQYGDQLQILELDTSQEEGYALYEAAVEKYHPAQRGVPTLVIGDHILIGSGEIPAQLPGLIENYLAAGGVAWPDLPNLPVESDTPQSLTWRDKYMLDPVGSTFCVVVLTGLLAAIIAAARPRDWQHRLAARFTPWGFLTIALIGLIAAGYLSYVETTQTTAVCGPVGDCNTVQQSQFALLFGFLPMAVFGLLGYLAAVAAFVYGRWGKGPYADLAPAATLFLTAFGASFSTILTFLEPFVIGATCLWCLTSAICMGLLLLFSAGPGWAVLNRQRNPKTARRRKVVKKRRAS